VGFVLPNHMMISIAEVLPREPNGILACCNPLPPLVKQQLNEIHRLLMDAKDVTFIRQSLQHPVQKAYASNPKYNSEKLLKVDPMIRRTL
jgi:exosome complex exonuclease RRP6